MKKLLLMTAIFFACSLCVSAHPGSTDDYGGHVDWSTGEYHYHHGYSAHQHTNGVCPYDFVDNADHSNNNSTSANSYNYNYGDRSEYVPSVQYTLKPSPTPSNELQNTKTKINWDTVGESLTIGAMFSVFPFIIYLFVSSFLVKGPRDGYILILIAVFSFIGCSVARYYIANNIYGVHNVYFLTAWMLIGTLLYEYFFYIKARKKYMNLYAGKDSHTLAGVPDGITISAGGTLNFTDEATKEKYTVYISSSISKYHKKTCQHGKHPISCVFASKNLEPCQICKPEIPDLSWYYKYQEIEKIKKDYDIK